MIISSKNLFSHLSKMEFPVDVLDESGVRVMFTMNREQLCRLINKEGVIGFGSHHKVKALRLNKLNKDVTAKAEKAYRASGENRESLTMVYRERSIENQPHTLKFPMGVNGCLGYAKWSENEGFAPNRFNPDRIPQPIVAMPELLPA